MLLGDYMERKQKTAIGWILFLTFWCVFVLTCLGVLAMLFFNFGFVKPNERGILINTFLVQTAAAVGALFFSFFNLRKQQSPVTHVREDDPVRYVDNFYELIEEISVEFEPNGSYSIWGVRSSGNSVTADYLYRIGMQKLLYAATKIHRCASAANLWACNMIEPSKPEFFYSAEREGHFNFSQLISKGAKGIDHRAQRVDFSKENLPVFALVINTKRPELVRISGADNGFDSREETKLGNNHILGIPSNIKDLEDILEDHPLSITVDLRLDETELGRERETIMKRAERLQDQLDKLCYFYRQQHES